MTITLAAALVAAAPALRANGFADPGKRGTLSVSEEQEARVEQESDLYEEATDALDEHEWQRAASLFGEVAGMKMSHADAALYWRAYALSKLGNRSEALSTLLDLQKTYPKSKWNEDAKVLEVEIRQGAGQKIAPEHVEDEELKLMALNGLMQSDPERAIPIIEAILAGNQSSKLKEKALFVLSQSDTPKALEVLTRIARNGSPDLQSKAVRFLGIMGGSRSREILAEIYNTTTRVDLKRSILKAYMISGDRGHLLAAAKSESDPQLRAEAVMQLGVSGARTELAELYASEPTVEVRKKIIQAMFIGGNADKLAEIAQAEKNLDLRVAAIHNLGLLGGSRTGAILVSLYEGDSRDEVRRAVIQALFLQSNAKALVALARKEKDRGLKHDIVQKLSLIHSKDATDYLMEFLKD